MSRFAGSRSLFNASRRQRAATRRSVTRPTSRRLGLESLERRALLAMLVSEALSGTADTLLSGVVYDDLDANGVKSEGDENLSGWTVYLDLDLSGTLNTDADGVTEPSVVTDQDGAFSFNHLKATTFRVAEVVSPGWLPTSPAAFDVAVVKSREAKVDFFDFGPGEIAGTVWNDLNADGTRNVDPVSGEYVEPGLAGWTVFLDLDDDRALGTDEPSTITASDGTYSFTGLAAGDYEVTEVLPAGWEVSKGFDIRQTASVVALQQATQDFANFSTVSGSLRGTIWNDENLDGARGVDPDTGKFTEPGLADWSVFLDLNDSGSYDDGEPSAVTNSDGNYRFLALAVGDYELFEILPDGWNPSPEFDIHQTVSIAIGEETLADDFANFSVLNGAIRGIVWNDTNRNGVRDVRPSGEFIDPPLTGWTVFLDLNDNGAADAFEPTAMTDADGSYLFADLQVGEYQVREVIPSGWETAPGFSADVNVTVYSGAESLAPDFANFNIASATPGTIAGTVWDDHDGNGLRSTDPTSGEFTEPGLSGWTLFADLDFDGAWDAGEPSATSAADGSYTLEGLLPGSVHVIEVPTIGWRATAPTTGQRVVTLRNGDNVGGVDFGNTEVKDGTIRGFAYVDANSSHVRDAGEQGVAGVTVYLDLNDDQTLNDGEPRMVTSIDQFFTPDVNETGAYEFTHLAKGAYTVRFVIPTTFSATPAAELEHVVTLAGGETRNGVNSGLVYRPTEIRGVRFDDVDGDHQHDPDEPGVADASIFVDLDRDTLLDDDEPRTTTAADGSYTFTGLAAGAYVIREVEEPGYERTLPTTVGGILWPDGVSHPAVGIVNPDSITVALADGESHRQTVSLTLPNGGALTNLVDVFLLFDDTGSFVNNSPIVRAAFPEIIAQLQASLPGIDLGFGVGRFEEYGDFAWEYASGRPFVLNQPIVAASTSGYMTAIQAGLDRTTPGYGGDGPETDIEALYQVVTGLGFDGNNNGSVSDSGPAGLAATQLAPGASGDVPSFASFRADPANSVMEPAGTVGGAGFRAGALPIILTATDIGFAYQPKGETMVTGVGGLTLPIGSFTQTSRATTPFNSGAGIQETVTALNALGALVIGLGTNSQSNLDPRQGLESLSRLTGAINRSATTIVNGTFDPIAPGDPLYFQIASGFSTSVANGVVSAIQNAVTNVAVDITIQASDPRVHIINHSGVAAGIGAGQTATFDIEIAGDGVPYRFDLQFVRQGTNVVLGSIPVVIGTPIPGDGYEFEDLCDGEIAEDADFGSRLADAVDPNVAPSFTAGADQTIPEDSPAQSIAWATSISPGPTSESWQTVDFLVTNDNATLFGVQPALSADGTLTYTAAHNANGVATVSVKLHDDGGTTNGGVDTSESQSFTITVTATNDAPVAAADEYSTGEDTPLTITAPGVLSNDADVENDALTAVVVTNPAHGSLTLNAAGSFVYAPDANFAGTDSFEYRSNDGASDSDFAVVTITVTATNDAPVAAADEYSTGEDTPLMIAATGVLGNDSDIENDALTAVVVTNPAHGSLTLDADGSFVYTPDADFTGTDRFEYRANDGASDSDIAVVTITVTATNDAPVAAADEYSTGEDTPLTIAAPGVLGNDSDVENDSLTAVVVTNPAQGSLTLDADGSFVYTPDADFTGTDSFEYRANDGAADSNVAVVTITVNRASSAGHFLVVDSLTRAIFRYDASGNPISASRLDKKDERPRGITTNAAGSTIWTVDKEGLVFVYDNAGSFQGSWKARGTEKPEGITTDGQSIWIVDAACDQVMYYKNAAVQRSGGANPTSRFDLARSNRNPTDLVTDGAHVWVVNDTRLTDTVFRYSMNGQLEGSWRIDAANSQPTGLTLDPSNPSDVWIVDAKSDSVYRYPGAAGRLTGAQAADAIFALEARNRRPQGIAGQIPPSAFTPPPPLTRCDIDWSELGDDLDDLISGLAGLLAGNNL